ncbi:MAG: hypothetical protein DWQ30_24610 [Acidobacteria bacterium]|nr:MAG: hypothetical protein DWQ30_24610 [Acidobacteriota bacterium]
MSRHPRGRQRAGALRRCRLRWRAALLVAALIAAPLALSCAPRERRPPDIILISLDTMRRDDFVAYRGEGVPAGGGELARLLQESVVYDQAFAPVPFTLPSHLSMLTGVYPDVHGVDSAKEALSPTVPLVQEALRRAGYRTLGVVSNNWMEGEFGFARGFDHYESLPFALMYSQTVNRRVLELIDEKGGSAESEGGASDRPPLFLFLHYNDAHSDFYAGGQNKLPYHAPESFRSSAVGPVDPDAYCLADDPKVCATDFLLAVNDGRTEVSSPLQEQIRALYRSGIDYLESDLEALLEGLRQRGLLDNALVIVTSDHGEEFLEHGEYIHSQPFVENLAVPLTIRFPDQPGGGREAAIVETIDLTPTLLDYAGLSANDLHQGASLRPGARETSTKVRRTAFGRDKKLASRFVLRTQRWSWLEDLQSGERALFDRRADPAESTDVRDLHPDQAEALSQALRRMVDANQYLARRLEGPLSASPLTEEDRRRLRSIGYVDV